MCKRGMFLVLIVLIGAVLSATAEQKPKQAKFKNLEVRHFTLAEGVELSPQFPDFLYAQLRQDFQKSGAFEQMLGENETVDAADTANSLIVDGKLLEYKGGNKAKEYFVGFGAGRRVLKAHVTVLRRSNNEKLYDQDLQVKTSSFADPKLLAKAISKDISKQVLNGLKK